MNILTVEKASSDRKISVAYTNSVDQINEFSATFSFGKAYVLDGPPGTGGQAISYMVSGLFEPNSGTIKRNNKKYPKNERRKSAWRVEHLGKSPIKKYGIFEMTIGQQIRFGLENGLSQYLHSEEEFIRHFHLTPARYERALHQLSNESLRASCAIGLANGKDIFCFHYIPAWRLEEECNFWLNEIIELLKAAGALVLLPTNIIKFTEHVGDEVIKISHTEKSSMDLSYKLPLDPRSGIDDFLINPARIVSPKIPVISSKQAPHALFTASELLGEPFEWIEIPSGEVSLYDFSYQRHPGHRGGRFYVAKFDIAKYPITNEQYQVFVEDEDGYCNSKWWSYSSHAQKYHAKFPKPFKSESRESGLPRTNIAWYDAIAFCFWLSFKTGESIMLPTEQQWQRAAQGDDHRDYPWGNEFDEHRCHIHAKGPISVESHQNGASPFGVMGLSGNVEEMCLNMWRANSVDIRGNQDRITKGGSYDTNKQQASFVLNVNYRILYNCDSTSEFSGFRCVRYSAQ